MSQPNNILTLIRNSNLLPNEKQYLIDRVKSMDMLQLLKLKKSLQLGQYPEALQGFQALKQNFLEIESKGLEEEKKGFLKQISDLVTGVKSTRKILSHSILTQPAILGGPVPQYIEDPTVRPLVNLGDFYHPVQLGHLDISHITFGVNAQNKNQIFSDFFQKLDTIFSKVPDLNIRRRYFMCYLQSPLFTNYLNTGLTVLRHPELQPPQAALNLLSQINPSYLNREQFNNAAFLTAYIRNLCGL